MVPLEGHMTQIHSIMLTTVDIAACRLLASFGRAFLPISYKMMNLDASLWKESTEWPNRNKNPMAPLPFFYSMIGFIYFAYYSYFNVLQCTFKILFLLVSSFSFYLLLYFLSAISFSSSISFNFLLFFYFFFNFFFNFLLAVSWDLNEPNVQPSGDDLRCPVVCWSKGTIRKKNS